MPNWAGSCWYYLRYLDPANHEAFVDPGERGVLDGPARHAGRGRAGGHARPGRRRPLRRRRRARRAAPALRPLLAQGAARPGPRDAARSRSGSTSRRATSRRTPTPTRAASTSPAAEVEETPGGHGGEPTFTWQGQPVNREYGKIGKSLKNVVSPDEMYDAYGADTFRVYEMSMGPLELSKPWETRAVVGAPALPAAAVAQRDRRGDGRGARRRTRRSTPRRRRIAAPDDRRGRPRGLRAACASTPRSPG